MSGKLRENFRAPYKGANLGGPIWVWLPHLDANLGANLGSPFLESIWGDQSGHQFWEPHLGTSQGCLIWNWNWVQMWDWFQEGCPRLVPRWDTPDWCQDGTPQMEANLESHLEANVVCNILSAIFGSQSVAP